MIINDKKFMKFVEATMNDFKAQGNIQFVKELQDILKKREITLMNISSLVQFLQHRIDNPSHYDLELQAALNKGEDFKTAHYSIVQLKKEHRYMTKILSKYFTWEENEIGLIAITKKFEEVA